MEMTITIGAREVRVILCRKYAGVHGRVRRRRMNELLGREGALTDDFALENSRGTEWMKFSANPDCWWLIKAILHTILIDNNKMNLSILLSFEQPSNFPRLLRFYLCVVSVYGPYVFWWIEVIMYYLWFWYYCVLVILAVLRFSVNLTLYLFDGNLTVAVVCLLVIVYNLVQFDVNKFTNSTFFNIFYAWSSILCWIILRRHFLCCLSLVIHHFLFFFTIFLFFGSLRPL